jgi:predicted ATPase
VIAIRSPRTSNLPSLLSSFVGRDTEIAAVTHLLWRANARLVTLTGAGGVGKTRLALQVATALLEDYPAGVWFVELASLTDPALVPQAVATVLGVPEEPGHPPLTTLLHTLQSRRLLRLQGVRFAARAPPTFRAY